MKAKKLILIFYNYLRDQWKKLNLAGVNFEDFWNKTVKDGGIFNNNDNYRTTTFNNNLKISNQINKGNNDSLNLFITPS